MGFGVITNFKETRMIYLRINKTLMYSVHCTPLFIIRILLEKLELIENSLLTYQNNNE